MLSVAVDGPSKANLEILDKVGGFVTACYTVAVAGTTYSLMHGVTFKALWCHVHEFRCAMIFQL